MASFEEDARPELVDAATVDRLMVAMRVASPRIRVRTLFALDRALTDARERQDHVDAATINACLRQLRLLLSSAS